MRWLYVVALLALGCTGRPGRFPAPPSAVPVAGASDSLILAGLRYANLVILGTPDSLIPEQVMAPSLQFGFAESWWNARISTEDVAKGKLSAARWIDYGTLPPYMTPRRPFELNDQQIVVQLSTRWQTSPVTLGERAVYFLKKCYNCVTLPARTQYRTMVSPWFAVLTLTPDQWPAVRRLAGGG
jgi:hypothetical protein